MKAELDEEIGADALLRNVAAEAASWAKVAERLDDLVGQLSDGSADVDRLGSHLQDMDALRQALHAIAQILSTAADDFPAHKEVLLSKKALAASVTMERVRNACLQTDVLAHKQIERSNEVFFF